MRCRRTRWGRAWRGSDTFDVHRVLRLVREEGVAGRAQEGFMRARAVEARGPG